MKKALTILASASFLFFASCGTPKNETENNGSSGEDSVAKLPPVAAHFKTEKTLPCMVDTTLLLHVSTYDSLGTKEIKELTAHCSKLSIARGMEYDLAEFYKIDSVKTTGTYASWCDSLTIGNTKYSNAYALSKTRADANTTLLLWALVQSSYEACPFSSVWDAYVTVIYKGEIKETFQLAEYASFGDPPVSSQREVKGTIDKDLSITINVYEENDEDMDQPEISVTRENYVFAIKEGQLSKVSEKKEEPVKIRRKDARLVN